MRYRRLLAVPTVALLLAAACGDDDDSGDEGAATSGDQEENTGTVNLMSAGEPEEVEAYQAIFDDLINSDTDYEVEIESVGQLRGAVPDPRRGRHPRRGGRAPAGRHPGPGRRRARSWRSRTWASTSTS